jgi:lipopolysaccharide transport system permease protein
MHFGFVWAFTRPVLYVLVFALFRNLSGANTGVDIPYPLYVFSGLIVWYYFLDAVMSSAGALQRDAGLLSKVYFPRIITPLVPIISALANLVLGCIPLAIMMIWFGVYPGWRLILLPVVLIQCLVLVAGVGTLVATLSLNSRDWDRFLQFTLYLGIFVSPVIYAPTMIPKAAQTVYSLNPLVGTLLAFRSTLFDSFEFPLPQFLYSVAVSVILFALGIWTFRRAEMEMVDRL